MVDEKMKLVKETLHFLIEALSENDRLSLIKFCYYGEKLCDLLPVNEENVPILRTIVDDIKREGGTVIHTGMDIALEVIKNR